MSIVIDSEAHAWVRLPSNWRHKSSPNEKRAPLSERSAANFKPARPNPDGSFAPAEDTSQDLLELMNLFGIDKSLIYPGPCMVPNDEVARVVALAPDRFIGFAKYGSKLPPYPTKRDRQAAADELEHGLRDLKLKGAAELSLGDWLPEPLETAQREMADCFELCKTYGDLPITVHAHAGGGALNAVYCDPASFEALARDFPTVPLILCHMGGSRRDFFDNANALAKKYDNVRFNTSQTTSEHLTEAVKKVGAERIHFGVDWYALDEPETKTRAQHRTQIDIVAKAQMTDRERALVMGESLARLLKIH